MLDLAILGLLKEQDLHGYELKKRLSETLGFSSGVSFGSLYPALGRLERSGAVRAVADNGSSAATFPATGSLGGEFAALRARRGAPRGGRSRKVYCITDRGHELFAELLAAEGASGEDDRTFNLRLAFARYLPGELRLGLLERRRAYLLERRSRLRAGSRRRERVDAYTSSLLQHDQEATEHDLSWIERLIAAERRSAGVTPEAPVSEAPVSEGGPAEAGPPEPGPPEPGPPGAALAEAGPIDPQAGSAASARAAGPPSVNSPTLHTYRVLAPSPSGLRPDPPMPVQPQEESTL